MNDSSKPVRGLRVMVSLPRCSTADVIIKTGVEHMSTHDCNFLHGNYELLYPDGREVINLPGSRMRFNLKACRDMRAVEFRRIVLYLHLRQTGSWFFFSVYTLVIKLRHIYSEVTCLWVLFTVNYRNSRIRRLWDPDICGAHGNFTVPPIVQCNTVNVNTHSYFCKGGCRHLPLEQIISVTYVSSMS